MRYPTLNTISQTSEPLTAFGGLNTNARINDAEFSAEEGMSSREYPVLASREKRHTLSDTAAEVKGIIAKDAVYYVAEDKLYKYDGNDATVCMTGLSTTAEDNPKQMVSFGAYILIYPDRVYYNTISREHGYFDGQCGKTADGTSVTIAVDGQTDTYTDKTIEIALYTYEENSDGNLTSWSPIDSTKLIIGAPVETGYLYPEWPGYRFDLSVNPAKLYYVEYDTPVEVPYYIMLKGATFPAVDDNEDVLIRGMTGIFSPMNGMICKTVVNTGSTSAETSTYIGLKTKLYTKSGYSIAYKKTDHDATLGNETQYNRYLRMCTSEEFAEKSNANRTGDSVAEMRNINMLAVCEPDFYIQKVDAPVLDYVFESSNRLWGCRYGYDKNGAYVNEIYASKLGDFTDWTTGSLSTDGFASSCGTDGPWTGGCVYGGYPVFFKEKWIYTVYGSYPAQYQFNIVEAKGVMEGCANSLVTINNVLYYKARSAVMAYDGSTPTEISYNINPKYGSWGDAVTGKYGNIMFLYLWKEESPSEPVLLTYDTVNAIWHREGTDIISAMCDWKDDLYLLTPTGKFFAYGISGGTEEDKVSWSCNSGDIGITDTVARFFVRLDIRMKLALGGRCRIFAAYDGEDDWEQVALITGTGSMHNMTYPVIIRRCQTFRLKFEGTGDVHIYSINRISEAGDNV